MRAVLALRAGLRGGRPVHLRAQFLRAWIRDPNRHLPRQAAARNHLRVLRAVYRGMPHQRPETQARVVARAGKSLEEVWWATRYGKRKKSGKKGGLA